MQLQLQVLIKPNHESTAYNGFSSETCADRLGWLLTGMPTRSNIGLHVMAIHG